MSHFFGLSLMLAAFAALACTAPTPTLVARERPEPLGSIPTERARGRVSVVDGRVVTDIGTPLRGLTLAVDFEPKLEDFELMTTIAQTTGLNTVHVYLENWEIETGARQAQADALVSLTAQAGLYLVLGIGGGNPSTGPNPHPGNGWFDAEKVASFWTLYAERYASSTHVLFEIQNNPELTCDDPIQPKTLDLQRTMYTLIRDLAPDSHVVLFSTSAVPRQAVVEQAIDDVSAVVDFSNASFAMHTDDLTCTPAAGLSGVLAAARAKQVPVLITALPNEGWPEIVKVCEAANVGWMHHRWLAYESSLDTLFTEMSAAKLSWCPDQGSYPAAGGCR